MYRKIAALELANFLGVIAHPERIRIIEELQGDELDVSTIQSRLGLAQASVSRHLALLKAQAIVVERKEGRRVFYHLSVPLLAKWLIAGLDIVGEKSQKEMAISQALSSAKELWAPAKRTR
jgi:DNA-binding transcriptional ArsR family regulator